MKKSLTPKPGLFAEATNTDIVFTFKPDPTHKHKLTGAEFSYSADPTAAYMIVEVLDPDAVGGTTYRTVRKHHITKSGPGPLEFVAGIETAFNTGLKVTLKAGGSGIAATFDLSTTYELLGH